MRFLIDEMLPAAIVVQMRERGIDAQAVVERTELIGMADADLLTVAASEARTMVTLNIGDYVRISRLWAVTDTEHAGILLVSSRTFPLNAARIGAITNALARRAREHTAVEAFVELL